MKLLSKKIVFLLSAIVVLSSVFLGQVFAQSADVIYEVYVENITLKSAEFGVGDTIKGSFTLHNNMTVPVSNVYYDIRLGTEYNKYNLPTKFFGSESYGPISLAAGQKVLIDFTYKLPTNVSGDVGLRIKANLESGNPLGFADKKLTVSGQNKIVSVGENYIKVGDRTFGLGEGPTLSATASGKLYLVLNVPTGFESLAPKISIFDRSIYGKLMTESALPVISLGGKATTSALTFDLPKFESNSGVYVGVLKIFDDKNNQVSSDITFRYIVGGDIFTINSVSSDRLEVKRGDPFEIIVRYSGSPENIVVKEAKTDAKQFDLEIKVVSADGDLIASHYGKISDPGETGSQAYKFIALNSAEALKISVVVKSGENVLANYNTNLPFPAQNNLSLLISIVVLAVLVILIIVFVEKKKHLVIASLVVFFTLAFAVNSASAWTDVGTSGSHPPKVSPNNSPISGGNYAPGEFIPLSGTVYQDACSNNKRWIHIDVSPTCSDSGYKEVWSKSRNDDHRDDRWGAWEYSAGFTAPTTPGSYEVCIGVRSYEDIGNNKKPSKPQGGRVIKQQYNVVSPTSDGVCGLATSTAWLTAPSSNLCSVGSAGAVASSSSSWTWNCNGTGGGSAVSCSAPIAPHLSAECLANPSSGRAPLAVVWSTNTSGGSGNFSYSWSGTDGLSGSASSVEKVYSQSGHKNASVSITRGTETVNVSCPGSVTSGGNSSGGGGIEVAEPGPLSVTCSPSPTSILSGESASWRAYPSGGKWPYASFDWTGAVTSSVNPTPAQAYIGTGPKNATVSVTDAASTVATANCSPLQVDPLPPTGLDCRVVRDNSDVNQNKVAVNTNTRWKAVYPNGTEVPDLDRSWEIQEGVGAWVSAGSANVLEKTFTTEGLKTVRVTLSSSTTGVSYECSLGTTATTSVFLPGDLTEI